MSKIDFDSIELTGTSLIIEFPTKSDGGLILVPADNTTKMSGWFKIIKTGEGVVDKRIQAGKEAFIYFHHDPYRLEEIIFHSREDQLNELNKNDATSNLVISDALGNLKDAKSMKEPEREFALVKEYDVLFFRDRK